MTTNQALPYKSSRILETSRDQCQNLGLILDKFAPWAQDQRGGWALTMYNTRQNPITSGEAKGLWLKSLPKAERTDLALMHARQQRWLEAARSEGGTAFTMTTAERLVAGLGASHVLETALTLERNTGLPYLPGSSVKGLARAWGLIEVAAQLGISIDDDEEKGEIEDVPLLNKLAETLISQPSETLSQELAKQWVVSEDAEAYVQWFRFIFGWQGEAGSVCFLDAIYAGERAPRYAVDVMTPHYVKYYTDNGGSAPTEDDNPNPVSFITVDAGNVFAFGLLPRPSAFVTAGNESRDTQSAQALDIATDWLVNGLSKLGAGSKTAAGYGFFNRKSFEKRI